MSFSMSFFATVKDSFASNYVSPFAIALGTKSFLIVILNSLWNIGPATQLIGSKLIGKIKQGNKRGRSLPKKV